MNQWLPCPPLQPATKCTLKKNRGCPLLYIFSLHKNYCLVLVVKAWALVNSPFPQLLTLPCAYDISFFLNQTSFIPTVLHQLFGCHAVGLSGSLKKKKISVKTIWRASPYCVNIQKQTHSTSIKRVKNAWIVLQGQWFAFIPFQHFA